MSLVSPPSKMTNQLNIRTWDLTSDEGCDMIDGVRERPLRSLLPGQRFELVLSGTTPYPHKRIPGTVIRHGPGTSAVVLDHAEKERTFTTREGDVITMHTQGGVQYWSPGTAVIKLPGERDISRWTSKGGTGIGLTPDAESKDELKERTKMAQAQQVREKHAALPFTTGKAKPKVVAGGKAKAPVKAAAAPKAPRVPKTLNDCLDGCGEKVTGRFRQGHDARYYSILKKVIAGDMEFNKMPRLMQQMLQNPNGVKKALANSKH